MAAILGFSVDKKLAIPCNVCNSFPLLEVQGNPTGREGISKVISERVAKSVSLICRKNFRGGADIEWNGPIASNCIRHGLESVREIKDYYSKRR